MANRKGFLILWLGRWAAAGWALRERLSSAAIRPIGQAFTAALLLFAAVRVAAPLAHLDHESRLARTHRQIFEMRRAGEPLRYPIRLGAAPPMLARFLFAEDFEIAFGEPGARGPELLLFPRGDPRVLDSTSALEPEEGVGRLLVIGGGIIGLEMAAVYDALGSEVWVVELLPTLMPGADADLVRPLARRIGKRYGGIHLETKVTRVEALEEGLRAHFEGAKAPDPEIFDRVLVSVGRRPNGARIGAEEAVANGLALRSVPVDGLDAAVDELVTALLAAPPKAAAETLALLSGVADGLDPAAALAAERAAQIRRLRSLAAGTG